MPEPRRLCRPRALQEGGWVSIPLPRGGGEGCASARGHCRPARDGPESARLSRLHPRGSGPVRFAAGCALCVCVHVRVRASHCPRAVCSLRSRAPPCRSPGWRRTPHCVPAALGARTAVAHPGKAVGGGFAVVSRACPVPRPCGVFLFISFLLEFYSRPSVGYQLQVSDVQPGA